MRCVPGRSARHLFVGVVLVTLCLGSASQVFAQSPRAEVLGGYAFLVDPDFNFPVGWYAGAGVPLAGTLSVVGEVGQSRKNVTEFGVPVALSVTTFQAGPRIEGRVGRTRLFSQVLVGSTRVGGAAGVSGIDVNVSSSAFSFQPGAGIVIPVSSRLGITAGADFRYATGELGSLTELRFTGGVSVGLGAR